MDFANLLVDPTRLKNQASLVENDVENIKQNVETMVKDIAAMRAYWKGEASEYQHKQFDSLVESFNQMYLLLKEYPVDILKMAGLYEETEEESKAIARSTPTSITMGNY